MPSKKRRVEAPAHASATSCSSTTTVSGDATGTGLSKAAAEAALREHFSLADASAVDDVWRVWAVASRRCPDNPGAAFASLGVALCGPFDLLTGESGLGVYVSIGSRMG